MLCIVYLLSACYLVDMRAKQIIFLLLSLIIISCDKGLSPPIEEEEAGFGGTIFFSGEWDSDVKQTNLVVFQNPLLSVDDFNIFNLKFVSESIPFGSQNYKYTTRTENSILSTIDAGLISYIAIAQSDKDTLSLSREDWEIVGLYYIDNDTTKPGTLLIPENTFLDSINIYCDFNNPPPQPPKDEILTEVINAIIKDKKLNRNHN